MYPVSQKELKENSTGLPSYSTFMVIYNFVSPFIASHGHSALPKLQQFVMVLMKQHLNLGDQDLAYSLGCISLLSQEGSKYGSKLCLFG